MTDRHAPDEWVEAANCLATVARTLASAVHEANNMLQVISGSAEMIQVHEDLPASVLKRTAIIAEHAHRVSALIGSLRDLSKFQPRQSGDRTNLLDTVNGALDLRRHAINRGHVAVTVSGGQPPVVARANSREMLQVVLNLLMNAERAVAGNGSPAIVVGLAQDGAEVVLSVGDNGTGMPGAVPDPFALQTLEETAPLLGLGLTATRFIATLHGGGLELVSGAGGTTATLRLPSA